MKPKHIANRVAREYVRELREFKGSNLYATSRMVGESLIYVVYSYGPHFPIYVAEQVRDPGTGQVQTHWYANQNKYSQSTTRHQQQARPPYDVQIIPMDTDEMKMLAQGGLMKVVTEGVRHG